MEQQPGSITVTGSGNGDLNWSGTSSGSATGITLPYTISNLPAGSYTIVLTDRNGCASNSSTEALSDPTLLLLQISRQVVPLYFVKVDR